MPFGVKKPAEQLPAGTLKLFNVDLHLAVIADVKHTLKALYGDKVHVTHWSICGKDGAEFGFEKPAKSIDDVVEMQARNGGTGRYQLNTFTWYGICEEMVTWFLWWQQAELRKYDGFIVTHSPVFVRFFESLGKPVILINSCRYDQPFCWNGDDKELAALNASLKRLSDSDLLVAISNNKADQEYLRLGAGVESLHVPSLCLYTGVTVDPLLAQDHPALVSCEKNLYVPAETRQLLKEAHLLGSTAQRPKSGRSLEASEETADKGAPSWCQLFHHKALIHFPYEVSTMSLAEQYSAGVILLLPSKKFLQQLCENLKDRDAALSKGAAKLESVYWEGYLGQGVPGRGLDPSSRLAELPQPFQELVAAYPHSVYVDQGMQYYQFQTPGRKMPECLECTKKIDWWLDRADFYDPRWFPGIKYFDSFEELLDLSKKELDVDEHRLHLDSLRRRRDEIYGIWRGLLEEKFPQLKS